MTPAEEALRDAWIAEMWKPVREHHQAADERAAAWARTQVCPQSVEGAHGDSESRAS